MRARNAGDARRKSSGFLDDALSSTVHEDEQRRSAAAQAGAMNFESEFRKAKKDYAAANNQVEDLEEAVAGNEDAVRINTLQSEATTSVTAVRRQVRSFEPRAQPRRSEPGAAGR